MRPLACFICLLTLGCIDLTAQSVAHAQKVQLAIPFGQVEGSLFASGDTLLFVDTEQPGSSFAVSQSEIESLTLEKDMLTLATKQTYRDRSGQRNRFVFKTANPTEADALVAWAKAGPAASSAAQAGTAEDKSYSYNVKHTHFPFGECTGKLVFSKTRFSYESVEEANHSRQWNMKDIREAKRTNPYEMDIKPFDGNDYKFKFMQKGMSSDEFRVLVDFVTAARMPK